MKSLLFGIYGEEINSHDFTSNIDQFSRNSNREIISYKFNNLLLFLYKGTTNIKIIENTNYFISITGDFTIDFDFKTTNNYSQNDLFNKILNATSGTFTICIYDKKNDHVILSNDLFNVYPLFYSNIKNVFMFSNEYQPLISRNKKEIKKENILYYLKYGFTYQESTFFSNVFKTKLEEVFILQKNKFTIERTKQFRPYTFSTYEASLSALEHALKQAVNRLIKSSDNPKITLTGGLDSRMILAMMSQNDRMKSTFLTFTLPPLNETNDKDVLIAKLIAKKLNLKHVVTKFEEKTEKLQANYFDQIRNDEEKIITGIYGGELLTSNLYSSILPLNTNEIIHKLNKPNNWLISFKHKQLKKELNVIPKRLLYFDKLTSSFFSSIHLGTEGVWVFPWLNQLRYFSPFMDTNFLKVWFSIEDRYLYNNNQLYYDLYSKYFYSFKKYPTNSFLPDIEKHGFTYFKEGKEPKKYKKSRSETTVEDLQAMSGSKYIPSSYFKSKWINEKQNRQRIIDFCFWYEYYNNL